MTDLEKTKAHFQSMGVKLTEQNQGVYITLSSYEAESENIAHDFNMGYSGFTADIFFTKSGEFAGMGGFE